MVIDKYLIHYKKPRQYIYWGETGVSVYVYADTQKAFVKNRSFDAIPLADIGAGSFQAIANELVAKDTGVLMNSGQFIFNIFDFEKLPLQEKLRNELVEWRLKKVFPENIEDYVHDSSALSRNRILSILFKRSLKENLEKIFTETGIPLIFIGNTTVEIINNMVKKKQEAPDFFIEVDGPLSMVVFLDKGMPLYIRKFRSEKVEGIVSEVVKTVNFVKNSYSIVPRTYSLAADPDALDFHLIRDELSKQELSSLELKNKEQLFLPA